MISPPGVKSPPFCIDLNTGGDIPPFSDLTVRRRGWYPPPGGEIPPILQRSQHWRWYPPLPVCGNFLTSKGDTPPPPLRIFSMCGIFEPFLCPFKTLILVCLKFRINIFKMLAEICLQCGHIVSILSLSLHLQSSFLLVLSQDSTFHQFCKNRQRPTW